MGFLGGLIGTGLKSAVTGAAREYKVLTSQEEKEPGFYQKENYKKRLEILTKEKNDYMDAENNNLNLGRSMQIPIFLPNGELFYMQNKWEFSIPTTNYDKHPDQINAMKKFYNISQTDYLALPVKQQERINASIENMGRHAVHIQNSNLDNSPKAGNLTAANWNVLFPNAPQYMKDVLNLRIKPDDEDTNVPQEFIEEATGLLPKPPEGSPLGMKRGEFAYGNPQAKQVYSENVLKYVQRKHAALAVDPKDQKHIEKKYAVLNSDFPTLELAAAPLVKIYLPPNKGGEALNSSYNPGGSSLDSAWNKSKPYVYQALIGPDATKPRVHPFKHSEKYHERGIEVFESLMSNEDMYYLGTGINPNEIGYRHIKPQGIYTAKEYRDTVIPAETLKIHTEKGAAWNIWKQVYNQLMHEFTSPLALGGKAYELMASFAHITSAGGTQFDNILKMLRADARSKPFADILQKLGQKFNRNDLVNAIPLTEGDKDWILSQDKNAKRSDLTSESMREAFNSMIGEDGKFNQEAWGNAPTHIKLLASVAKQRSLTLMGTYLAAAIIQGEGGKAISDHDQKLTEKILQYGWFTTPQQRVASLSAVHDILSLQGVVSSTIANATNAETVWAAMQYQKVANSRDPLEASLKANDGLRWDAFPVDKNGNLLPDDNLNVAAQQQQEASKITFNMIGTSLIPGATGGKELPLNNLNLSGYITFPSTHNKTIVGEDDLTKAVKSGWEPTEEDKEYISIDQNGKVTYKIIKK
jgi:hypothetical protein